MFIETDRDFGHASQRRPRNQRRHIVVLLAATVSLVMALTSTVGATVDTATSSAGILGGIAAIHRDPAVSDLISSNQRVHSQMSQSKQIADGPSCTFNGATDIVPNVMPGSSISIACSGWAPDTLIAADEVSPLVFVSDSQSDIDPDVSAFTSDGSGGLSATFTVPNPFTASDPAAVCPPTASQVSQGYLRCALLLVDTNDTNNVALVALNYASSAKPLPPPTSAAVVGMAATPDGGGYWLAWSNGSVTVHGDAQSYGNVSQLRLNAPIAHIVATPSGNGYWLVASDGGTFAFGDAGFYGSMGGQHLNQPVVDMAPTGDGRGYWLVAADGGIFAFGDARFHGSMGAAHLNEPVVGIAADNATGGYWEVASDGGIFAFDAPFHGSTGAIHLNQPVNGMTPTPNDGGYWFVASDGGLFAFGNAQFHGSMGGTHLNGPVVGMATDNSTGGYWMVASDGGIFSFDAPFYGAA